MLQLEHLARRVADEAKGDGAISPSLYQALQAALTDQQADRATCAAHIERARRLADDDLEIDDDPIVSLGDDGVWVQAWMWVPHKEE